MKGTTRRISSSASTRLPGPGLDPADVDDVGALGDDAVGRRLGRLVGERRAAVVERVGGAVDDRHDQRAVSGDRASTEHRHHIRRG